MANFDVELNDEVENFNVEFGEIQRITVDDFDKLRNRPSYAGQTMSHETNIPEVPTAVSQLTNDADYQTGSEVESAISTAVGDEKDAREQADAGLSRDIGVVDGKVDAEADARERADIALQGAIDDEETARKNADNGLQGQIDAITSSSDVVDIVGTYAELLQYPTAGLGDKDVIKVLQDETHNDAMSYYRWNKSSSTWSYIGSEGPYYTKSETNTLLGDKQDTLTAGSNITISSNNTISSTDTTYTAGNGLTLTGTEFSADTTVLQPKLTAGDSINISAQNVISADIDPADFFTASETVDGTSTDITLNNTIQAKIKSVQIDGDTTQETTTGKNKAKTTDCNLSGTNYSFTIDSGNVAMVTTASLNSFDVCGGLRTGAYLPSYSTANDYNLTSNGGEYILSVHDFANSSTSEASGSISLAVFTNKKSDGRTITKTTTSVQSLSFSLDDDEHIKSIYLWVGTSTNANISMKLQLEAGSTATTYELYTGGIPAPNPDYPQDIHVVTGEQTVAVNGKNKFDINGSSGAFRASKSIIGHSITSTATTSNIGYIAIVIPNSDELLGEECSISYIAQTSVGDARFRIATGKLASPGSIGSVAKTIAGNGSQTDTITFPSSYGSGYDCFVVLLYPHTDNSTWSVGDYATFTNIQIEVGSATTYQPYSSQSYMINLGGELFDKSLITAGYYLDSTGASIADSGWCTTDYMKVESGRDYAYSGITLAGNAPYSAFYDKNKNLVSTFKQATGSNTITIPSGVDYAKFSLRDVSPNVDKDTFSFKLDGVDIELCKIGTHRDSIYKDGNDWYLHKETNTFMMNSSLLLGKSGTASNNAYYYAAGFQDIDRNGMGYASLSTSITPCFTPYFTPTSTYNILNSGSIGVAFNKYENSNSIDFRVGFGVDSAINTLALFKTWLDDNKLIVHYSLATPTNTKITDATLISELNALADALGYKDKTIITVSATGTNLPAILEVSAYRNSLAGVLGVIGRAEAA